MFNNLEFFLLEAWTSFRRSGLMSMVAIGIVTVSLVIFGFFMLSVFNLSAMVGTMGSRLDISTYVEREIDLKEAGVIQVKLSQITGVEKVDYISKDEAWKNFINEFGNRLNLNEVVQDNPLPHTFIVKVRTAELVTQVADTISKLGIVDEVRYSGKLITQIQSLISAVRIGGLVLVLLLSLATLLIVVNTIRLTVLARETDISIMRLVGATKSFIRWPFIIEGVMIGIIGSVLSVLVLKFSYDAIVFRLQDALPFLPIMTSRDQLIIIYSIVAVLGTLLGMMGGYISVSKMLKE